MTAHTHTYYTYTGTAQNIEMYQGSTVLACPLGHARCSADISGAVLKTYSCYLITEVDEINTSSEAYTSTHTHTINFIEVLTTDTEPDNAGYLGSGAVCDVYPTFCRTEPPSWPSNCATSLSVIEVETSAPIGDYSSHYHTYDYPSYEPVFAITGWTTCSQGHANCRPVTDGVWLAIPTDSTSELNSSTATNSVTVTTLPCLSTGNKSAILGGQYTIPDSATIGVEYWYDSNWVSTASVVTSGSITDYIRYFNITGLAMGRTYYFRAYAYIEGDYFYGDTLNFTTDGTTVRVPSHTEYNNARYCIRQIEKVALGRSYVDEDGNFTYESRLARNA